jgi:glycosyltransferase involved in cell wall biosynthesis
VKVSVLILTCNEEANLPACLDALSWCDDIVALDSGSTDRTVEISVEHGVRVLSRPFDSFAGQRNFGLDEGQFRHEWVLHLDADEIVTEAFAAELAALEPDESIDAWRVPFKTMFFGRWLRYAGMWPSYQVRLGHSRRLRFVQAGHGQRERVPPERVGEFPEALLHYSFSHGLKAWFTKHVRYAGDEAAALFRAERQSGALRALLLGPNMTARRRAAKSLAASLPLFARPFARFGYVYFYRRGFLDGKPGFVYALMLFVYEAMTAVLAYEAKHPGGANRIPQAAISKERLSAVKSAP